MIAFTLYNNMLVPLVLFIFVIWFIWFLHWMFNYDN